MRLTIFIFMVFGVISLKAQEKVLTNQHFWYSMKTTASPQAVWAVWTNVSAWKTWDIGLKDASIDDTFTLGTKGEILSLENRKAKFKVVEFVEGKSYTYKTKLPLGGLYVKRYLTTQNKVTTFTHEVWFKGLTKGVFSKTFGGKFRAMLPEVLSNIQTIVEK